MTVLFRILFFIIGLFILPLGAHALWWTLRENVTPSWRPAVKIPAWGRIGMGPIT